MELKQMAKRKAEAQKIREEKAFMTDPPTRTAPYTVPKPFHLTPRTAGEGRATRAGRRGARRRRARRRRRDAGGRGTTTRIDACDGGSWWWRR